MYELILFSLLLFLGFILELIVIFYFERKIRSISAMIKNKVHFYVTCEVNLHGFIVRTLWIGKPHQTKDKSFFQNNNSRILAINHSMSFYHLNYSDFDDMKKGEIREVFLNMEE